MSKRLILIRHGESLWNYENRFAGWANVPLTNLGIEQSKKAGSLLLRHNIIPEVSYTSIQKRSIDTNKFILKEMKIYNKIKIKNSWRLNERHYGKITGLHRENLKWKGDYFDVPPNIRNSLKYESVYNNNYNPEFGESYYMTYLRVIPIWNTIKANFLNNNTILVCSHKNTIKVLIRHLENLKEDKINNIEVENCLPHIYNFNGDLSIVNKLILK